MTTYEPTIAQFVHGNPTGEFAVPDYVRALIAAVLDEMSTKVWNRDQEEWSGTGVSGDQDPGIPGIAFAPYYWGNDPALAARPNLAFGGVEIRWYKFFGRGMSCTVEMDPAGWVDWFDRCVATVRAAPEDGE